MTLEARFDAVTDEIRAVAAERIVPRFRALAPGEVTEKGPGDLVTVADTETERELTRFLADLDRDAVVIGEEAVAADPGAMERARLAPRAWVIDPLDGTANFVAGSPDFAVMVALIEDGRTTASWIHHPIGDRTFTAVRGAGAFVDGVRIVRRPAPTNPAGLRATLVTRLLDPPTSARVAARAAQIGVLDPNRNAAGIQYPRVAEGELDAVLWWRSLVWDHAAGALLVEEAGGRVVRLDGSDYEPWSEGHGLLVAADQATSDQLRAMLAPGARL